MTKSIVNKHWCRVSFRLMGNALDVDSVSTLIGIEPSSTGKIGDETRFGEKLKTNLWVYQRDAEANDSLVINIEHVLQILETKADAILRLLTDEGIEGQLFVGLGSCDSIYISKVLLNRIGRLGLSIDFDLY